jgi:hypothetical protein
VLMYNWHASYIEHAFSLTPIASRPSITYSS